MMGSEQLFLDHIWNERLETELDLVLQSTSSKDQEIELVIVCSSDLENPFIFLFFVDEYFVMIDLL